MLYKYHGHLGAHLIAGGVDCKGKHLVMISAYGKYSLIYLVTLIFHSQLWDQDL